MPELPGSDLVLIGSSKREDAQDPRAAGSARLLSRFAHSGSSRSSPVSGTANSSAAGMQDWPAIGLPDSRGSVARSRSGSRSGAEAEAVEALSSSEIVLESLEATTEAVMRDVADRHDLGGSMVRSASRTCSGASKRCVSLPKAVAAFQRELGLLAEEFKVCRPMAVVRVACAALSTHSVQSYHNVSAPKSPPTRTDHTCRNLRGKLVRR